MREATANRALPLSTEASFSRSILLRSALWTVSCSVRSPELPFISLGGGRGGGLGQTDRRSAGRVAICEMARAMAVSAATSGTPDSGLPDRHIVVRIFQSTGLDNASTCYLRRSRRCANCAGSGPLRPRSVLPRRKVGNQPPRVAQRRQIALDHQINDIRRSNRMSGMFPEQEPVSTTTKAYSSRRMRNNFSAPRSSERCVP